MKRWKFSLCKSLQEDTCADQLLLLWLQESSLDTSLRSREMAQGMASGPTARSSYTLLGPQKAAGFRSSRGSPTDV